MPVAFRVHLFVKPGQVEVFKAAIKKMSQALDAKQSYCISHRLDGYYEVPTGAGVHLKSGDPLEFVMNEVWTSVEDFQNNMQELKSDYDEFFAVIEPIMSRPREVVVYEVQVL